MGGRSGFASRMAVEQTWRRRAYGQRADCPLRIRQLGTARPAGEIALVVRTRFQRARSDTARGTQRHQWVSLKHEIEEIRKRSSIQGYTITEFTDLNWECNGLLDMFRNKKIYADDLARLQQQDVIFARAPASNYV